MALTSASVLTSSLPLLHYHLMDYIISFREKDPNFILNLYKAFLHEADDPLCVYKARILNLLSRIAYATLSNTTTFQLSEFSLSEREIMYIYDVKFGDEKILLTGAGTSTAGKMTISVETDKEFDDIKALMNEHLYSRDYNPAFQYVKRYNPTTLLKHIRLLEAALFSQSEELIRCILVNCYDWHMAMYIYIKYNNPKYKNRNFAVGDDMPQFYSRLLELLLDVEPQFKDHINSLVLRMAIGGIHRRKVYIQDHKDWQENIVLPNLQIVKALVPHYISPLDAVLCFTVYYGSWDREDEDFRVTPLYYWRRYDTGVHCILNQDDTLIQDDIMSDYYEEVAKDITIRDYLLEVTAAAEQAIVLRLNKINK